MSTNKQDICFHIGLSRAASTALQRDVFPVTESLGKWSQHRETSSYVMSLFTRRSPKVWQQAEGQRAVQMLATVKEAGNLIFSYEHLYNNYFFVDFDDPSRLLLSANPYFLAEHMEQFRKHAWGERGDVGVFFLARNQADWLVSRYSKSSAQIKGASQADFDDKMRRMIETPAAHGAQTLEFDLLTEVLRSALGQDRVLPEVFERISEGTVLRAIAEFTGLSEIDVDYFGRPNEKLNRYTQTSREAGSWNLRNYKPDSLRVSKKSPLRSLYRAIYGLSYIGRPKRRVTLTPETRSALLEFYRPSNERFSTMVGRNLTELGYY